MMQIVIDIAEDEYKSICEGVEASKKLDYSIPSIFEAVRNGTPLPKGHGALIDRDALYDQFEHADYDFEKTLEYAPTIIPADTESGGEE